MHKTIKRLAHTVRRSKRILSLSWHAPPAHSRPLKHIDHQFIVSSSSEFSIPSKCVDPRTYVDWSSVPFLP
jgi:hypothetical protein